MKKVLVLLVVFISSIVLTGCTDLSEDIEPQNVTHKELESTVKTEPGNNGQIDDDEEEETGNE
ncbi:hypothetical protein [uncultured Tenacibaculum sp.]|uniref:hypothetical protein n=1 Tax=uncultured Tenacibaculum sp. TaxID=174713 RepID=UPI002624EC5E|nr:hypothetical protein [uncultured Tenacibaculum sp.]